MKEVRRQEERGQTKEVRNSNCEVNLKLHFSVSKVRIMLNVRTNMAMHITSNNIQLSHMYHAQVRL